MMLPKFFFSLLLASTLTLNAAEKPLPDEMLKIMQQPKYVHATWGIYVKDTENGNDLYDLNSDKFFLPASTTKVFSVAALLHALGDDYRFKTPVYAQGKIENGRLKGNLILVGQGDLTFGGRQKGPDVIEFTTLDHIIANSVPGVTLTLQDPLNGLNELARQIKEKGITEVDGDILIDDRLFETVSKHATLLFSDLFNESVLVLSPVMINENLIDLMIKPTEVGQSADVQFRPKVTGYTVTNKVKTVAKGEKTELKTSSDDEGKNIVIEGSVAADQKELIRTEVIKNPTHFAKLAFIEALQRAGIKVNLTNSAKLPESTELKTLEPISVFTSPPLSEYAKLILKVSHNIGADLVPLILGSKVGKKSYDEGMKLIGDFLVEPAKISKDSFVLVDAAGGDDNRLTPKAEVALLSYIRKLPKDQFKNFYDALPILGVDGSLADFGKNTGAVGKARAKTGTGILFNAATGEMFLTTQTLMGYVEGKNGHLIEFMISVNNAKMPTIEDIFPIFEDLAQMTGIIYNRS